MGDGYHGEQITLRRILFTIRGILTAVGESELG